MKFLAALLATLLLLVAPMEAKTRGRTTYQSKPRKAKKIKPQTPKRVRAKRTAAKRATPKLAKTKSHPRRKMN